MMGEILDLHTVVRAGDLVEVQKILSNGHDIGEVNPTTGMNSLHLAVLLGNYDMVELLTRDESHINSSCSLQYADFEGYTPLHFSVDVCNKSITQLLLSRNANVNKQNKHGNTALHVAASCGVLSKNARRFLLKCQKHWKNDNCSDILHSIRKKATDDGYCDIADILLQSGADAQLVNIARETALHVACRATIAFKLKSDSMAHIILKKFNSIINFKNINARTALHVLANSCNNSWELAKTLIEYGADIDATDDSGYTPVYYACRTRKFDVVRILIENCCNVNIGSLFSPFKVVVSNGDEKILKLLLMYGVDTSHIAPFFNFSNYLFDEDELNAFETITFESCCNVFFKTNENVNIFAGCENLQRFNSYFEVLKLLLQHGCFKNIYEINLCSKDEIRTCFVKYLIKIKTLGCWFARDYPDIDASKIDLLPDEKEFEDDCKREVEILKRTFLCSGISLHDFLIKDSNKMVRCLKNEEIVNTFNSPFKPIYPIYGDLINAFFKFNMQRRSLLNRCCKYFNIIFCQFPKLPYEIIENIFGYLTTDDLNIVLAEWDP